MNNLVESAMTDCVIMNSSKVPDGFGGYTEGWEEGLPFEAAFDYQTSVLAKIGESQGVTGMWNLLIRRSTQLVFHNVIKRLSDGQIFRITSKDDKEVPASIDLDLKLVSAEEWKLT